MIKADGLSKRYGPVLAADNVSFSLQKGEVLGFLGPNGAGKSTTMRIITGFVQADSGKVTVGGCDIEDEPIKAKSQIGYLPENAPSYPDMSVEGFLGFIAAMKSLGGAAKREAVEEAIVTCSLEPVRRQTIETLSKGYRHRTCFAQALLGDPEVLVMDEPTDGLDPNQKHEMRDLIRRLGERKAIVLSTHILEEVDAVCSRVIIIDRGRVVYDGNPADLRARADDAGAVTVAVRGQKGADVSEQLGHVEGVGKVVNLEDTNDGCRVRIYAENDKLREGLAGKVYDSCAAAGWKLDQLQTENGRLDIVFRAITTTEGAKS